MTYEKFLDEKEIRRRSRRFGFAHDWLIEIFIWDFEILSRLGGNFVLKGGAATQLFLSVKDQRSSVDIDIVTELNEDEIEEIFHNLKGVKVKKHIPKAFKPRLPLVTYFVRVPSITRENLEIKVDVLMEKNIPSIKVKERELFALTVKGIKCVPKSYLIADKVVTLSSSTLGIPKNRKEQLPKHIYDLTKLTKELNSDSFQEVILHFGQIVERENKYRKASYEIYDVIEDVDKVAREYIELKPEIKKDLLDFQSVYLSKRNRLKLSEWKLNLLRVNYVLKLIRRAREDEKVEENFQEYIKTMKELLNMKKLDRETKKELRRDLLTKIKSKYERKKLGGTSAERLYLELKNQTN